MKRIIKVSDIFALVSEFTELSNNKVYIVNCLNTKLQEDFKQLNNYDITLLNPLNNKEIVSYFNNINITVLKDISLIIMFNLEDITFNSYLIIARLFYCSNIKYIVLIREKKIDTKSFKAFLVFYKPYRIFKNALLLRRA